MLLSRYTAEQALEEAGRSNPGPWVNHSRYVAQACRNIAARCPKLDADEAYIYGILHDIGRHAGVTSERHLIDGYRYCMARGWGKAAQICISHAFMVKTIDSSIGIFDMPPEDKEFMRNFIDRAVYNDYDLLAQLCDACWKSGSLMWRCATGCTRPPSTGGRRCWTSRPTLKGSWAAPFTIVSPVSSKTASAEACLWKI